MTSIPLVNLWSKRSLVYHFAKLNIKIRFKGTYLGFLWAAIEPTLTFLLLWVVFTNIREREENFAVYLITGLIIYHIFARGTFTGLTSIQSHLGIIKAFKMRGEFFPVSAGLTTFLLMLVEIVIFFSILIAFQYIPTWTVVAYPLVILLLITLILGISYFLSIIFIFFKDIQLAWGIIIHAFFFMSPIFWYLEGSGEFLRTIHLVNPIGQIIELSHHLIIYGTIPPLMDWIHTTVFIVAIFFAGFAVFQLLEKKVVEAV